jgi:O-antigen/teichoic acid export membrane protein
MRSAPWNRRSGDGFTGGILWNTLSFGLLGLVGILLSTVIGRFYGPADLGAFNQTFVLYAVLSQLGAGGLHLAVVRLVPRHVDEKQALRAILASAVLLSLAWASLIALAVLGCRSAIAWLLGSERVEKSLLFAVPGVFLFSVNKVLLGYVNGLRRMRVYALAQALRAGGMAFSLGVLVALGTPGFALPILLASAEALAFLYLIVYLKLQIGAPRGIALSPWIREQLRFAVQALPAGLLTDLNPRIEVLLLGALASDTVVGIYSLAAMFAQGFTQIIRVLTINLNPVIARLHAQERTEDLARLMKRGTRLAYLGLGAAATLAVALFPLVVRGLIGSADFSASWHAFSIIAAGVVLGGGFMPFLMLPNQIGMPRTYVRLLLGIGATKMLLGAVLIPLLGLYGAAITAGLGYVVSAILLRALQRKVLP